MVPITASTTLFGLRQWFTPGGSVRTPRHLGAQDRKPFAGLRESPGGGWNQPGRQRRQRPEPLLAVLAAEPEFRPRPPRPHTSRAGRLEFVPDRRGCPNVRTQCLDLKPDRCRPRQGRAFQCQACRRTNHPRRQVDVSLGVLRRAGPHRSGEPRPRIIDQFETPGGSPARPDPQQRDQHRHDRPHCGSSPRGRQTSSIVVRRRTRVPTGVSTRRSCRSIRTTRDAPPTSGRERTAERMCPKNRPRDRASVGPASPLMCGQA